MKPDVLDWLARYGRHDFACDLQHSPNLPGDPRCTCGFSEAQVKAELQHNANAELFKQRDELLGALKKSELELLTITQGYFVAKRALNKHNGFYEDVTAYPIVANANEAIAIARTAISKAEKVDL